MAKPLTAAAVAKLKPAADRREVPDAACPGLYLVIHATGRKGWALRYRRPDRRSAKLVLGTASVEPGDDATPPVIGGHLSLAAARRLAARLRHEIAQGRDPAADHIAKRSAAQADTFGDAARDFIEHARRRTRRWRETAALLGLRDGEVIAGGLAERWRDRPLAEIDEDALFRVVDEARAKGVPGLAVRNAEPSEPRARALFAALSVLFSWLRERRRVRVNPLSALKRPAPPRSRDRVLDDDEIRRFWQATGEIGEPFGAALKLLLLTGARLAEVAGMRSDELSANGATWLIPGERTKNRRPHVVPLAPLAREIIAGVARVPASPFVFSTTGYSPISGWSKTKGRLDARMGSPQPWRLHDLRRTAVTGMARAGADLAVCERAVNHISGSFGGIVAVYQRHKFETEVAAALNAWANLVSAIVSGERENVVTLRGGGAS